MLCAVLFDLGGTLDGDGEHWLDRFALAYAEAGLSIPRAELRDAFDEAERRLLRDETVATARLDEMVARHVGFQLERLSFPAETGSQEADGERSRGIAARFVRSTRLAVAANRSLLSALARSGLRLGVVSNGCGNVDVLCDEFGFSPFLSTIIDSKRVGLVKPDPAIFLHAAARLGSPPESIMMVGDSFDRDVRPAKSIGMRTAWLEGPSARPCPDSRQIDLHLRSLAELPGALERFTAARTVA